VIYREAAPTGIAGEFVGCFWMLEDDAHSSDIQRIIPDGRCELILNFSESFESQSGGASRLQPRLPLEKSRRANRRYYLFMNRPRFRG
jgi:hypothetical protein